MTPQEYLAADQPGHGAVVCWYVVDIDAGISQRRAVYHVATKWDEHPWSGGWDRPGADFEETWAIESRYSDEEPWRPLGRSGRGWNSLIVPGGQSAPATKDEALASLTAKRRQRVERLRATLQEAEESLEAATATATALAPAPPEGGLAP